MSSENKVEISPHANRNLTLKMLKNEELKPETKLPVNRQQWKMEGAECMEASQLGQQLGQGLRELKKPILSTDFTQKKVSSLEEIPQNF